MTGNHVQKLLKKLHWLDFLILGCVIAFFTYVFVQMSGNLNYHWRWEKIPNYIFKYHTGRKEWFANLLLQGLIVTVRVSIYATILALILGVVLGIARCSHNLVIRMLARTYLEFLRNIPPLVVIFIFYFFLAEQIIQAMNIESWSYKIAKMENNQIWEFFCGDMRRFPSLVSGVIVLALFESAFVGEIVRAGIQSVDRGQREAARSVGMSGFQEMQYIVLPQAMKKIMPPMANQFITLIKDSSIISLISVQELTYKTAELVSSTHMIFEAWLTTAAFYFVICFGLSLVFRKLERRK
jgi:polar amino acid transport system permease protein